MDDGVARFGEVEFDHARARLRVGGRATEIDRSCAAILSLLLREGGRCVDKDRLLEAGWPGRVVHENSLAKAIGRLRQALGAHGEALETVHGYGYRLAVEEEPAPVSPAREPQNRGRTLGLSAAGLGALALFWFGAVSNDAQDAEERPLIKGEPADTIGRVLWVDDHPQNNTVEKRFLEARKVAVYQVGTSEDALALLAMYEYGAVISDMNRNDRPLAGLELVAEMRRRRDRTPYIVYTVVPSAAQRRLVADAGGQRAVATSAELYQAILPLFRERKAQPSE